MYKYSWLSCFKQVYAHCRPVWRAEHENPNATQQPDRFHHLLANNQRQRRQKHAPRRLPSTYHVQCPSQFIYKYQDPLTSLTNYWISLIISIHLHILKCLSVCLWFCMLFFHDQTEAPMGPKFWVEALQNMGKVLRRQKLTLTSVMKPPKAAISVYLDVRIRQCCRRPASKR